MDVARAFPGFALNAEGTRSRTVLYKACIGDASHVVQWLLEQEDYEEDKDGSESCNDSDDDDVDPEMRARMQEAIRRQQEAGNFECKTM